jgi:predicted RNA methylase
MKKKQSEEQIREIRQEKKDTFNEIIIEHFRHKGMANLEDVIEDAIIYDLSREDVCRILKEMLDKQEIYKTHVIFIYPAKALLHFGKEA